MKRRILTWLFGPYADRAGNVRDIYAAIAAHIAEKEAKGQ